MNISKSRKSFVFIVLFLISASSLAGDFGDQNTKPLMPSYKTLKETTSGAKETPPLLTSQMSQKERIVVFHTTVDKDDVDQVHDWLKNRVFDVNVVNPDTGRTALFFAKSSSMVWVLKGFNANHDAVDNLGNRPGENQDGVLLKILTLIPN
jgi:hypothetical protein